MDASRCRISAMTPDTYDLALHYKARGSEPSGASICGSKFGPRSLQITSIDSDWLLCPTYNPLSTSAMFAQLGSRPTRLVYGFLIVSRSSSTAEVSWTNEANVW